MAALAAATLAYFAFFHRQALVHWHYFVPAMPLPLIVYWRLPEPSAGSRRRAFYMLTAAGGVLAMVLSWPTYTAPFTVTRAIGSAIQSRLGGYERQDPSLFRRFRIFEHLTPSGWAAHVPDQGLEMSCTVMVYYAHRSRLEELQPNYILTRIEDQKPPGGPAPTPNSALHIVAPRRGFGPGYGQLRRGVCVRQLPSWMAAWRRCCR